MVTPVMGTYECLPLWFARWYTLQQCSKYQVTESRDVMTRDSDSIWTYHDKLEQSDN